MTQLSVNTDVKSNKVDPFEIFENSKTASDMIPILISVPRGALDLLTFRYYKLGIINDNKALAETAIQETVQNQLAQEFAMWNFNCKPKE